MGIQYKTYSLNQLKSDKDSILSHDELGMTSFFTDKVFKTLLACPNADLFKSTLHVATFNEIIVGRRILIRTKLKAGPSIVPAQTGGSNEVNNAFRRRGIASNFIEYNTQEADFYIGALYTPKALSLYKKWGCVVLESPIYTRIQDFSFLLKSYGFKGYLLKTANSILKLTIRSFDLLSSHRLKALIKKYDVRKEQTVPEWAGQMATNDEHKYMEYHDSKWLQWCLDYSFVEDCKNKQSFYSIYNRSNQPVGFFMTKVRYEERGIHGKVLCGTIVEWASIDYKSISESDIYLLAVKTFEPTVEQITTIASYKESKKKLCLQGFLRHGSFQMCFKDKYNQYPDAFDQHLWRIRYGCCNTILL